MNNCCQINKTSRMCYMATLWPDFQDTKILRWNIFTVWWMSFNVNWTIPSYEAAHNISQIVKKEYF